MARRSLKAVLDDFVRGLRDSRRLAADAHSWSVPSGTATRPMISHRTRDTIAALAFFRAYLAWETFLEETFVLYLSGQRAPRGRPPGRYAFPPDQKTALEWMIPEGRPYARWTIATEVSSRAERFFRDGGPFARALRGNQSVLDETRTIRNAVAHDSANAQEKFEALVRMKLKTLPSKLTVGSFLGMTVPQVTPPLSFLDFYENKMESAARQIVPS